MCGLNCNCNCNNMEDTLAQFVASGIPAYAYDRFYRGASNSEALQLSIISGVSSVIGGYAGDMLPSTNSDLVSSIASGVAFAGIGRQMGAFSPLSGWMYPTFEGAIYSYIGNNFIKPPIAPYLSLSSYKSMYFE
jgi:hypothetical protein